MPTDITVTELKETVTVTESTTSITVTGDSATVSVATTSQPVSVIEENATFTINTIANKADIGLGNVDDTSDANKPVSTATQSALNAKLNKAGDTMTGSLTLAGDPAANLQAATKQYVDSNVNAVPVINTTDDVAEGSVNLYYTDTRVNSAFDTRLATKSTTNVAEGTNLYHTTTRARNSISATGSITYNSTTGVISYTGGANPVTTDELPEGTTNKYYTDTRVNSAFDTRLATKSTSNLNEGSNLYYTTTRSNSDFDTRLATKATTNLAEGTNLYYTSARANTDFDGRLAIKSTTNLTEGSNLYHTTARARAAVSGSTGITYTEGTGTIAVDSTIATKTYADSAAASAAAALVDASPATLDTLNELAAALGDDPNFATTVSTALGNKLNTADFGTTFAGQLEGKSTTDVAEGTNLYYTDTRARSAISAGGSLSYNSTTGVVSYTTPSTDGITEGTNLYYTDVRVSTRINNTSIDELSDVVITSAASGQMMYYNGTNWVNSVTVDSANLNRFSRTATGTGSNAVLAVSRNRTDAARATDNGPWLGFEYVGTDNSQATAPQNAIRSMYDSTGSHKLQFLQLPGTYSTPTVIGQVQRGNTFFNNTSGGNMLNLSNIAATVRGTTTTITNSPGTTTYASLGAILGSINQNTFNINNGAGTTTYATFTDSGTTISGDGLSTITRTTVGTPTVIESRPSMNIQLIRSDQAGPTSGDSTGFRSRVGGSNGDFYTISDLSSSYSSTGDTQWALSLANGDQTGASFSGLQTITSKISATTISAGVPSATPGASTIATKITFDAAKITAAVPFVFPSYTATAANAITGAVGWQICITDSASGGNPNGMMAFWDTTHSRWSYIHDNSAV